jgi:hypothetical protein
MLYVLDAVEKKYAPQTQLKTGAENGSTIINNALNKAADSGKKDSGKK